MSEASCRSTDSIGLHVEAEEGNPHSEHCLFQWEQDIASFIMKRIDVINLPGSGQLIFLPPSTSGETAALGPALVSVVGRLRAVALLVLVK